MNDHDNIDKVCCNLEVAVKNDEAKIKLNIIEATKEGKSFKRRTVY